MKYSYCKNSLLQHVDDPDRSNRDRKNLRTSVAGPLLDYHCVSKVQYEKKKFCDVVFASNISCDMSSEETLNCVQFITN